MYYYCFNHGFKFQNSVSNGCLDLRELCLNLSDIAMITVKDVDYYCIIHDISKSETIHFVGRFCVWWLWMYVKYMSKKSILKNGVYKYCFDNSIKAKKLETKKILIDEERYRNLVIYFTRYVCKKLIKM